jgi:hypothetical protein
MFMFVPRYASDLDLIMMQTKTCHYNQLCTQFVVHRTNADCGSSTDWVCGWRGAGHIQIQMIVRKIWYILMLQTKLLFCMSLGLTISVLGLFQCSFSSMASGKVVVDEETCSGLPTHVFSRWENSLACLRTDLLREKMHFPRKWVNQKPNGTMRKCSSRAFQWMVMSVGFDNNLKFFGQFLCPFICHHPS